MTRNTGFRLAAALAAALTATAAGAGVRVELSSAPTPPAKGKALRYVVWIDGPRLAAELARKNGAPTTRRIVFRSAEDLVWLIDSKRQTYYQLDPASAQQAASQVAGLRQGLESGLESLTPEQRAAVRDLLGELAKPPSGPAPEYRLRERGELGRYAEIACARHDVLARRARRGRALPRRLRQAAPHPRAPRGGARPRRLSAAAPSSPCSGNSRACAPSRPSPPSRRSTACRSSCAPPRRAGPATPW